MVQDEQILDDQIADEEIPYAFGCDVYEMSDEDIPSDSDTRASASQKKRSQKNKGESRDGNLYTTRGSTTRLDPFLMGNTRPVQK